MKQSETEMNRIKNQDKESEKRVRNIKTENQNEGSTYMAHGISDEMTEYVGILAKLELSGEEKERAGKDMARMLDYIDKLNELDTTGVEPLSHVFKKVNVFREDVVTNGGGREAALANAPRRTEQGFVVPKTF